MKDKLNDLVPWLEKLQESLAKVNPDDDREEVERRSQLARFVSCLELLAHIDPIPYRSLEDIGTRSLTLSEKGKVARLLDKTQDSQEVVKLVEKLRQAILIYQVSARDLQSRKRLTRGAGIATAVNIQPSRPLDREILLPVFDSRTQRLVCQFKASFDVLLKLHQVGEHVRDQRCRITRLQTSPVKNKIESVRARLDRIGKEVDATRDPDEFRRRKCLFECVFPIRREPLHLKPVSELWRGSRTSLSFYLDPPVPLSKRRRKGTWPWCAILQMI